MSERITLPRSNRDKLIEIRRGKYSLSEIRELGAQLESEALAAQATSPLPDELDRDAAKRPPRKRLRSNAVTGEVRTTSES
jgi:hypothetical protein